MIDPLLPAALCLIPQIIPPSTPAVIVGGALRDGRIQLSALALGDGGVAKRPGPTEPGRGQVRTPGGILVRAQVEGCKLDFPSGRELLLTPAGRLHLRSGETTLPFLRGVRLALADGAMVTIRRSSGSRRPLRSVEVEIDGRRRRIWSGTHRVTNASLSAPFRGSTLLVLGDGNTVYRASVAGPLMALERVLYPKRMERRSPPRRLVIVGDVLARSLALLPAHAPRRSVQFPQVEEAARRFAALGPLFRRTIPRPPGAVGELWFELCDRYRIKVEANDHGIVTIGLYREGSSTPGVEWIVGTRTTLHFVRPDGGARGGPRFFMRGIDLRELVGGLLPVPRVGGHHHQVAKVITALGGRAPRELEVRRR